MQCDAVTIIVSFLSGGIAGAIATNVFNKKNARDNRKTSFLAFLNVWESEVEKKVRIVSPANVFVTIGGQFDAKRSQLIEKATELELNYRNKTRVSFWEVYVKPITDMTPGEIDSNKGREAFLEAIRNLATFVRKN